MTLQKIDSKIRELESKNIGKVTAVDLESGKIQELDLSLSPEIERLVELRKEFLIAHGVGVSNTETK